MDGHHLLPRVLQLAPERHFRLYLHLFITAHRRFRQEDGVAAQGEDAELTGVARHVEGEQRLGGAGVAHHHRHEIRGLAGLLQMTGEIARHPESDKLALCCHLHLLTCLLPKRRQRPGTGRLPQTWRGLKHRDLPSPSLHAPSCAPARTFAGRSASL